MAGIVAWVVSHGDLFLQILGAIVALASLVVKLTPTPKDDGFLATVVLWLRRLSIPGFRDEGAAVYIPRERPLIEKRQDTSTDELLVTEARDDGSETTRRR